MRHETHAVATRVSGSKWVQSARLDIVNGSLCNLRALALGLAYTVLMSPNKDETAVHSCDPTLSVLVMFGVSKYQPCSLLSLRMFRLAKRQRFHKQSAKLVYSKIAARLALKL